MATLKPVSVAKRLAIAQSLVASGALRVERGRGAPEQRARGFELGRHVGEAELQRLELVEAFAERLALLHVGERLFERRLRAAERTGADVEPAAVEAGHRDLEADAFFAKPVCGRHAAILENHGAGRLRVPAHLALVRAELEAGGPAFDHERRNPFRAASPVRAITTIEVALVAGAGNELLLPVQHVVIAVADRPRAQRGRVRTAPGSVRQ